MGTSVGMAGGSLAERRDADQHRPTRVANQFDFGASGPLLVSVSGAPPTPRCARLVSSGSTARPPAIFSQTLQELSRRNPDLEGRFQRIDERRPPRRARRRNQFLGEVWVNESG
jgi:hypothetical protein